MKNMRINLDANNQNFKYKFLIDYFLKSMPNARVELDYETPFQLLIAVILSAQCTDKRVNQVTRELFLAYPDAKSMSESSEIEIFEFIKSVSYPNSKTKYLYQTANIIHKMYNGDIPSCEIELQKLPGVGRKTAHVVAFNIFNKPTLAVDTHVFRVAKRLGLVDKNSTTPLSVEKQLTVNLSDEYRGMMNHWLVLHGRYVCKAISPQCGKCGLKSICDFYKKM